MAYTALEKELRMSLSKEDVDLLRKAHRQFVNWLYATVGGSGILILGVCAALYWSFPLGLALGTVGFLAVGYGIGNMIWDMLR